MLTRIDGSRIDANTRYPHKGIVRGTNGASQCKLKLYSLSHQPIKNKSTETTKIICEKLQLTALRNP